MTAALARGVRAVAGRFPIATLAYTQASRPGRERGLIETGRVRAMFVARGLRTVLPIRHRRVPDLMGDELIEPGAVGGIPETPFHEDEPAAARDERSMMLLEYLISIVAFLAAALLAVVR